ncbi:uncharacterized protein LOC123004128 [Tribolium madens]|uniref:uncharacterized protein LOC123004128 n=1 Tax=Tribolium madens TaxID=41895 RepID=UPI001CF75218|nr:uncharacterized protein LOC123004128 [Tribolium madens]
MFLLVLIFLALTSYVSAAPKATGCSLNVLENNGATPLFLNLNHQFPNPTYNGSAEVEFNENEILYIACPKADTTISNYPLEPEGEAVRCVENTTIYALTSAKTVDFNSLTCHQQFRPYFYEQFPGQTCDLGLYLAYIGQNIANHFTPVVKLCFNLGQVVPLYSKYTTNRWSALFINYNPNIGFSYVAQRLFGNLIPGDVYTQSKQTLENMDLADYITDDVYLVPGQLADYNDFLSLYQRDLTFDYANTAPLWNTIKNGNWKSVVSSVQKLITQEIDLGNVTILSGTLDIATLGIHTGDHAGQHIEVFLDGKSRMPVPAWFWKLMIAPSSQFAILFFVYNNPYVPRDQPDYDFKRVCKEDVLGNLNWVEGINNTDPKAGITFACLVGRDYLLDETMREIVNNALEETNIQSNLLEIPSLSMGESVKAPQKPE